MLFSECLINVLELNCLDMGFNIHMFIFLDRVKKYLNEENAVWSKFGTDPWLSLKAYQQLAPKLGWGVYMKTFRYVYHSKLVKMMPHTFVPSTWDLER